VKNTTDARIKSANEVSKELLIETIKTSDPTRFDQMLIEKEERKTYFYVKYKYFAFSREVKVLNFPLFRDLVSDFEETINFNGDPEILYDDRLVDKVSFKGYAAIHNQKYAHENLVFSDLKLVTDSGQILSNQPYYLLPEETERHTCSTCEGEMYTCCEENECHGQHIYDCSKCDAHGIVDCNKCNGNGRKSCPTCNGSGRIKCKGHVGPGSGGAVSNAVYGCSKGISSCTGCYGKGCASCGYKGKTTCVTCGGEGYNPCSKKYNSNFGVGKLFDSLSGVEFCEGRGLIECSGCDATGKIVCSKCNGNGRIECSVCYGDYIDNRYGKVDCKTCETAGELASISYVETHIKSDDIEFIYTDGENIVSNDFGVGTIKKHIKSDREPLLTYKFLNGDNLNNYDEYSEFSSAQAISELNISKEQYPLLVHEEIFYEGIPCATFHYNHFISATFHDVSVLGIDKDNEVFFHSDPKDLAEASVPLTTQIFELLNKAFSTKSFKDKIDRKHEMFLMIHMAKADGQIEEQEKRYLSKTITGLQGFTRKEKVELFNLMSSTTLPPILPINAYFSSTQRAEEAKNKIIELVAKADREFEPQEKAKLEEINNAIETGFKVKPTPLSRFFKTWQVSVGLFLVLCSIGFGIYYRVAIFPKIQAEREALNKMEIDKLNAEQDSLKRISNQSINENNASTTDEPPLNSENFETTEGEVNSTEETLNQDGIIVGKTLYKIQDPDGYSNLRAAPNGQIIKKVFENETFEIIGEDSKHKKVMLSDGTVGFIHESRVVLVK
jgi:hypothetical protein